jgi:hypothetical protein
VTLKKLRSYYSTLRGIRFRERIAAGKDLEHPVVAFKSGLVEGKLLISYAATWVMIQSWQERLQIPCHEYFPRNSSTVAIGQNAI